MEYTQTLKNVIVLYLQSRPEGLDLFLHLLGLGELLLQRRRPCGQLRHLHIQLSLLLLGGIGASSERCRRVWTKHNGDNRKNVFSVIETEREREPTARRSASSASL
jgi:hypothetical protein